MSRRTGKLCLLAALASAVAALGTGPSRAADVTDPAQSAFFESKVRPVLAEYCYKCHSVKSEKVKGGLLLMALVEKENITVSDDDLAERFELISGGNPDMLKRIKDYYSSNKDARNALISETKEEKAVQFLLDNAVVTEVDAAAIKAQ